MRTYVITGGTTGIGACVKQQLEQQGHRVYNVDYKGGDFCADLSQKEGRQAALEAIHKEFPEGLDGGEPRSGDGLAGDSPAAARRGRLFI